MINSKSNSPESVSNLIRSLHRSKKAFANKRLILKTGEFNISQRGIKRRKRQYLADIFTTLIDLKWRWSLVLFVTTFLVTWFLFGLIWWTIAYLKGDIENIANPDWSPCVSEIDGYVSALLFSIETQQTIGYGTRSITKKCPEAIVIIMIQATFGVIIQALLTGLIFAKLARPQKRAETLMFSKTACICMRNGELVLLLRVGDMRSSHIIGAHMDALLIRRKVTEEGEVIPLETENIDLGFVNNRLLLRWPVIIEHKINQCSPLWNLSKADLDRENFEILVILEGSVPSTGASTQAMTSYLPQEILWGQRFVRLNTNQRNDGKYLFDYQQFHETIQIDTPSLSAREISRCQGQLLPNESTRNRKFGISASPHPFTNSANIESVVQWVNTGTVDTGTVDTEPGTSQSASRCTFTLPEETGSHIGINVETASFHRGNSVTSRLSNISEESCFTKYMCTESQTSPNLYRHTNHSNGALHQYKGDDNSKQHDLNQQYIGDQNGAANHAYIDMGEDDSMTPHTTCVCTTSNSVNQTEGHIVIQLEDCAVGS